MNDLSGRDIAPERFRQRQRVEREEQLVMPAELVEEDEANRDELRRVAAPKMSL